MTALEASVQTSGLAIFYHYSATEASHGMSFQHAKSGDRGGTDRTASCALYGFDMEGFDGRQDITPEVKQAFARGFSPRAALLESLMEKLGHGSLIRVFALDRWANLV